MTRDDANPTGAASVQYTVTFDSPVTGVDVNDFEITKTGSITDESVAQVTGDSPGASYTVTVNTGSGEGTIRLDISDNDTIIDGVGDPLGGTGVGNGNFAGQVYTVEASAVTGTVWSDDDKDGVRDGSESGIAGVTVYVDSNNNTVLDGGEPFATTLPDDGATPGVDETGNYAIEGLRSDDHQVRIVVSGNNRQSSPLSPSTGQGLLTLFENAPRPPSTGGNNPHDILVSPDGEYAIVGWEQGRRISSFRRDSQDGQLTFLADEYQTTMYGVRYSAFSPDGRFIYLASEYSDAINVVSIDAAGSLSFVQATTIAENDELDGVSAVEVTPDGTQLLAVTRYGDSLSVYDIDSGTGQLTLAQVLKDQVDGVTGLQYARQPRVTADGKLVVVPTQSSSRFSLFNRDPATGVLTQTQTPLTLGSNADAIVSPDGRFIYVADFNSKIWTLSYDPVTVTVTSLGSVSTGSIRPERLAISPDGSSLYATADYSDGLLAFSRDVATGAITQQQSFENYSEINQFDNPRGVAVSPDGRHLYSVARNDSHIQTFWIDQSGRTSSAFQVSTLVGQTAEGVDFGVAVDAPLADSITALTPSPTDAGSVDFAVSFSESVTGVDASDFEFFATTFPSPTISSVSGGPTDYIVTVTTPEGAGNVQLQLVDDDSILDADLVPIGGTGTGAVAARSEAVLVDSVAPGVVAIAPETNIMAGATSVDFFVTFDEPVSQVDTADFSTTDSGAAVSSIASVTPTSDETVFIVTVGLSGGVGTVTLNLADNDTIIDVADNPLGGSGTLGAGDGSFVGSELAVEPTSIRGQVWFDANQNSLRDPNEAGRAGVVVFADLNENGVLDGGEPSTTTVQDVEATSGVDETGQYELTGLANATNYVIAVQADAIEQTSPLEHSQDSGLLTIKDQFVAGQSPDTSLDTVNGVTVSPDGRHVYTTASGGDSVRVFSRDPVSDTLTSVDVIDHLTPDFSGFSNPYSLSFTPDGKFAYIGTSGSVYVVQRDSDTGVLSFVARYDDGTNGLALKNIRSLDVSPDGRWLYVTALTSDSLSVFEIDEATGHLQLRQQLRQGVDGVRTLNQVTYVQASPDAAQVFVSAIASDSAVIYDVIPGSGRLVPAQLLDELGFVYDVAFSPGGRHLYTTESYAANIRAYSRDPATGDWLLASTNSIGGGYAFAAEVSPDGRFLYAVDTPNDIVRSFSRDLASGSLTPLEVLDDTLPHDALDGATQLAVTPDGRDLLVVSNRDDSLSRFGRFGGTTSPKSVTVTTTYQTQTGVDFGVFNQLPSALSLETALSPPTNAASFDFTLTFDEPVSGVDTSDFRLEATTLVGASVDTVGGGPLAYTITVTTGSGTGPIQLTLLDDDTIVDGAGDPIGGEGDNASITSAVIDVDRVPPSVSSVTASDATNTNASSVDYLVTFSEDVTGVDTADFALTVTDVTGAVVNSVTPQSATEYLVHVDTGDGDGTIRLDVIDNGSIIDAAGNSLGAGFTTGDVYSIDKTVPTPSSILIVGSPAANASSIEFSVTFSEAVTEVDSGDFLLTAPGLVGAGITSVSGSGATRTVTVATGTGHGSVQLDLVDNESIVDVAGNPLGGDGPVNGDSVGPSHTVDTQLPSVTAITTATPSPTIVQSIAFTVTFDEPVVNVGTADFAITQDAGLDASITSVDGSGTIYTVNVDTGTGSGSLRLDAVTGQTLRDGADNGLLAGFTAGDTINVDRSPPSVLSINRADGNPTVSQSLDFHVVFDEAVNDATVDTGDFQIVASGVTGGQVDSVTGSGTTYTVTVTHAGGDGTIGLNLVDNDTIVDDIGNKLGGSGVGNGSFTGQVYSVSPPVVTGTIFRDLDNDGYHDVDEPGLSGITVYVDLNDNGIKDGGEPSAVSQVDDGGTPDIDETGWYRIDGADVGTAVLRVDDTTTGPWSLSTPRTFNGAGTLSLVQEFDPASVGHSNFQPLRIAISPDGNFMAAASLVSPGHGVSILRRAADGTLSEVQWYDATTLGIAHPEWLDFTPDGRFLLVESDQGNRLTTYTVDRTTGALSQGTEFLFGPVGGLSRSHRFAFGPDSRQLYVTTYGEDKLRVFNIDDSTGAISLAQQFVDGVGDIDELEGASTLIFSPDAHHLYVHAYHSDYALNRFVRDPSNGLLTLDAVVDNWTSFSSAARFSSDGSSLYMPTNSQSIHEYTRDTSTGDLTFNQSIFSFGVVSSLQPTDDGQLFYSTSAISDFIATHEIDPSTGAFTEIQRTYAISGGIPGLDNAYNLLLSPDNRFAYTLSSSNRTITAFQRAIDSSTPVPYQIDITFGQQPRSYPFGMVNETPGVADATTTESDPTTATAVDFDVTFSESVTGVEITDFALSPATLAAFPSAAISAVSGSPTIASDHYTVSVTGLIGSDQVELLLDDDDSIVDVLGAALDGVGTGQTSLITLTVDNIPPTVDSIVSQSGGTTSASSLVFDVTFSEAVTEVGLDDFELQTTGITGASITDVSGSGDVWTVTVNTGSGDGTLTLSLADNDSIVDQVDLPLGGTDHGNGNATSDAIQVIKTGTIAGRLWHDADRDGQQDSGEGGIPGLTVYVDLNDNGVLDSGSEPSDITEVDNPGTTGIDEAGQYEFTLLDPGNYFIRVDTSPWVLSGANSWDTVTASSYVDATNFAANNKTLRVSPDGKHLYVFDHSTDDIVVLAMPQSPSDSLAQVQVLPDQFTDTTNSIGDIAFTPDGAYLYMIEEQTDRLAVYERDSSDGTLVRTQLLYTPTGGPYSLEVAPDGKHLYVGGSYVAPYLIDPDHGTLTALANTGTPARVQDLVFNSDGTRLYASDYGNVLMRVYSRDPSDGSITQIQATGSQIGTSLNSNWSIEISDDDQDVYVAAPLTDIVWHFRTLGDGTLDYAGHYDLDTDGQRDVPMDLQLSNDGKVLFVAVGLDDAIQLLHRDPADGSLTIGAIHGTKDPSISNIYDNSSSLLAISADGNSVVRVNNRAQSIERYRGTAIDALEVSVVAAATSDGDLGLWNQPPELVSITSPTTSVSTADPIAFTVTFSEEVSEVDRTDFQLALTGVQDAVIDTVSGGPTVYTITVDMSAAYGQGDLVLQLTDDDSIVNAQQTPLDGFGTQAVAGNSPTVTVDLPAPTLLSMTTSSSGAADLIDFSVVFSDNVTGVDTSDFLLVSGDVSGIIVQSVTGSDASYTVTLDASAAVGTGNVILQLKDDDSVVNDRSIPLDGVGNQDNAGQSAPILVDRVNPAVTSMVATNSPILDYDDVDYVVTFSEPVSGVNSTDFIVVQSGVSGASVLSVTPRADNQTFDVVVDSGSFNGTLQLQLIDDDSIVDGTGKALGGDGANNGDFLTGDVVPVERYPTRDIVGYVFVDSNSNGVRDLGEPGAAGAVVYLDTTDNDQRDSWEYDVVSEVDDPATTELDETGFYRFTNRSLGDYEVRIESSVEWIENNFSYKAVTLAFETVEGVADLAVTENQSAIVGHVFDDANQDGLLDAGESGLAGWTVYLDSNLNQQLDSGEPSVLTAVDDSGTPEDETGSYSFGPLELTFYNVRVVPQTPFLPTTPIVYTKTLTTVTSVETANFGVTPNLTRISGAVFDDANADGVRTSDEPGIADWTVFLDENLNDQWDAGEPTMQTLADDPATTSVDESGLFEFTTLSLGTHRVVAVVPADYISTSENPVYVSFAHSTDTAMVDFALRSNDTTISGFVFDDLNRDGMKDGGETGVEGVTVYSDQNDNGRLDAGEPTEVTASDGSYSLLHVQPGDAVIRIVTPQAHELTSPATLRERVFLWHGSSLLREIDPLTGAEIKETYLQNTSADSLAFDGQWLWAVDKTNNAIGYNELLQIHPDSHQIVDRHLILASGSFHGVAATAGSVYAIETSDNYLYRFDSTSGKLTHIFDLAEINAGSPHFTSPLTLSGAAGETADGSGVLLETDTGRWLVVDPASGIMTGHFDYLGQSSEGFSGNTGSYYVADHSAQQVVVYDDQGTWLRAMDVSCGPNGLASGFYLDTAHRLNVTLDQVVNDLNFGARYYGVDIDGVQFDDLNDNGVQDAGEGPLEGVVVFADTNDNGWPDPHEVQTVSAADGSYTLSAMEPGTFTVRAISPEFYRPSSSYPTQDRLFAVSNLHPDLANCQVLVLTELDPATGAVLGTHLVNTPNTQYAALTFDGQRLVLVNDGEDYIYQLAYDGTIISETRLAEQSPTGGFPPVYSRGPVFVGGFLFTIRGTSLDQLTLWQFDLSSSEFTYAGPITVDGLPDPTRELPERALANSTDGTSILLGTREPVGSTDQSVLIDPFTRTATMVDDLDGSRDERGLATIGDETFVAYDGITSPYDAEIVVYDNQGNVARTLSGLPTQRGLAGGVYRDNGVTLTLAERTSANNVNHSHHLAVSTISGNVSDDLDASGSVDAGEPPLAGITVYIDANHNSQFDAGEPFDVTDSGGQYTIQGVMPGQHVIRQVPLAGRQPFAVADGVTRLFTQSTTGGVSTIFEIDPVFGGVLNQFPAPGPAGANDALTLYQGDLYVTRSNNLFRLNADTGEVLDTLPSTSGLKDALVIRDGVAYMISPSSETLDQVDLLRRRVIDRIDLGVANFGDPGSVLITGTYGISPDGDHFVVNTSMGSQKVDFVTGVFVEPPVGHSGSWPYYDAIQGDEYFRGYNSNSPTTLTYVYDDQEALIRTLSSPISSYVNRYAADTSLAEKHAIWVQLGSTLTDIDFGNRPVTGTISGVQFDDSNGNGVLDAGESPLPGITVFVDQNANDFFDAGEPSAVSGADGTYTIVDVPNGTHLVRAVSPQHYYPTNINSSGGRLLGTTRVTNGESPTGYYLQVREVDPQTGSVLLNINTTIPVDLPYSAAFDGRRIVVVDNNLDKLFEIAQDGTLLDEVPLPGLSGTVYSQGPVVVDGTIYLLTSGGGMPQQLMRYDPDSNQFYGATPLSRLVDQDPGLPIMPSLSLSLSEAPDGNSILAMSLHDSRVFVIDPLTARITSAMDLPRTDRSVYAATALGGQWFVRGQETQGRLDVYDDQFNLLQTLANPVTPALGGGIHHDTGAVVTLAGGNVSEINLGHRSTLTTISGTILADANHNRAADAGETPEAGVTVYLDSNRNGQLDAGERTTITLADGSYSFDDLVPGDYSVRVDAASGSRGYANVNETALYAVEVDNGVSTIRRHDPLTGQELWQFAAPGVSSAAAGLANDDNGVYYASGTGLWILDPITGAETAFVDLPDGVFDGVAALDGDVFVQDSETDTIYKINPLSASVIETFDFDAINPGPQQNEDYDLFGNLGETQDDTRLFTRSSTGGLRINPDTAVVEEWFAYNGTSAAVSSAAGEVYRSWSGSILVQNESEQTIRSLPIGYFPYGIGAAVVTGHEHRIRAASDLDFTQLDFVITPAFEPFSSTIRGSVWDDADQNGIWDAGESGIAGVTVYLDTNENHFLDAGEPRQTTAEDDPATSGVDETGQYRFENLPPGHFPVRQLLLPSHVATTPTIASPELDTRYETLFNYNGFEHHPLDDLRLSAGGQFLVFATSQPMLPSDTNSLRDIYLVDRATGQTELISVNTEGRQGNGNHFEPDVTADGRYVIFRSGSTNLDPADTDGWLDIFIRDRQLGTTSLLTHGVTGGGADGQTRDALITPDGQQVIFYSWGPDLVTGDTNNLADTFILDRTAGEFERISVNATSGAQLTDDSSYGGDLSADGRFVTFESKSSQILAGDSNNGENDIFWMDRVTGQVQLVSASSSGVQGNSKSQKRAISDDGRWVVFDSLASNLTSDPHPGPGEAYRIYLKDMVTGQLDHISASDVVGADLGDSQRPEISGDGRFIVFESDGQLVAEDTNQRIDVYLFDAWQDTMFLVSSGNDGLPGNGFSNNAVISADGSTVAFTTTSSNILGPATFGGIVTVDIKDLLDAHDVHLLPEAEAAGNDFGQTLVTGQISGTLWQDQNVDGTMDSGEPVLANRTVFLDINNNGAFDTGEPTQVTDAAGWYTFSDLAAGQYTVRQLLPGDWSQTAPQESMPPQMLVDNDYVVGQNTAADPWFDSAASDNGRYVAFTTLVPLLPSDNNSVNDVYIVDNVTGELELASVATDGSPAVGHSFNPSISDDGRFVAFRSASSNFSGIDQNGDYDIFVRDRLLQTTTLVSVARPGQQGGTTVGNSYSYTPVISGDGRFITFWSASSNLVVGDTNNEIDLFLRDLHNGTTTRINLAPDGSQAVGGPTYKSQPSHDGRYVGYWSKATNLVADDTNNANDVFLLDRQTGLTERVSVSQTGVEGNGASDHFSMSDDGRYFVFQSNVTNWTNLTGIVGKQIYLKDRQSGEVKLVSVGHDGSAPNGASLFPSMSADGRWVVYYSHADNLVADDTNGVRDVFVYDVATDTTTMISRSASGDPGDGVSDWARMSRDGSTIVFNSEATNLELAPAGGGGLFVYQTQNLDPQAIHARLGIGEFLLDHDFGSQVDKDFGDAPDSYGTLLASGGPRHTVDPAVRLGSTVSGELNADGIGSDEDDDGVEFVDDLVRSQTATVDVTTSAAGELAVWIDFDQSGTFENATERLSLTIPAAGTHAIDVAVPADAEVGQTYARFRFSSNASEVDHPTGAAADGEVEDYAITIKSAPTDITPSASSIDENIDTSSADVLFTQLSAVDPDTGDTHTYRLVAGDGDTDNFRFNIVGSQLMLNQGEVVDHETRPSYNVRIEATDSSALSVEVPLTLDVNDLAEIVSVDINGGLASRSQLTSLIVTFDTEVDESMLASAFTITNIDTITEVGTVNVATSLDPSGRTVATLTFDGASTVTRQGTGAAGNSLDDGNYRLDVWGSQVRKSSSGSYMSDDYLFGGQVAAEEHNDGFFRLLGDTNGDGYRNGIDLNNIIPTLFNSEGYRADCDTNGDGYVNGIDLNRLIPTLYGPRRA